MSTYITTINIGIGTFLFYSFYLALPILLATILRYKKLNFMRVGMSYMMFFYSFCVLSLVFLPIPTAAQAMTLNDHNIQLIPFHFVIDIINTTPFVISNIHTYLPSLLHGTVLQVVFNVIMTIPFGMFLRYYFGLNSKKILLLSLCLTLFIEIGQLTGLFFLYKGSYRLCDIDDIMTNTLGGYLGYCIVHSIERYIPSIKAFDIAIPSRKKVQTA